jgi:hypothetical protein
MNPGNLEVSVGIETKNEAPWIKKDLKDLKFYSRTK